MGLKIGSKSTARVFGDKLSKVTNGFQIKPRDFKPQVKTAPFNNGGKGGYVVQCNKLVFSYCESGGSSKGASTFIKSCLISFAKANPETEIVIKHQPWSHPKIEGHYNNGNTKSLEVKNLAPKEILVTAQRLQSSQGGKEVDFRKTRVLSTTPSVRGIWSPFHSTPHQI